MHEPKSRKYSIIGYGTDEFSYKCYNHKGRRSYILCGVTFNEDVLYKDWSMKVVEEQLSCVEPGTPSGVAVDA